MQQYRYEDILQAYYPYSFTFNRDDVIELQNTNYDEDMESVEPENELFNNLNEDNVKYKKFYKNASPRKRVEDWRSEGRSDTRIRDDIRMRDKHYYKKKEKKREDTPVWSLPPQ